MYNDKNSHGASSVQVVREVQLERVRCEQEIGAANILCGRVEHIRARQIERATSMGSNRGADGGSLNTFQHQCGHVRA